MRKKHNLSPVILFFFSSTYHHHKSGNPIDCPCPIVYTTSFSFSCRHHHHHEAPVCENCIPLSPPSLSRLFFARAWRERTHAL